MQMQPVDKSVLTKVFKVTTLLPQL